MTEDKKTCCHEYDTRYTCPSCKWQTKICGKCGWIEKWSERCTHEKQLVLCLEKVPRFAWLGRQMAKVFK